MVVAALFLPATTAAAPRNANVSRRRGGVAVEVELQANPAPGVRRIATVSPDIGLLRQE